MLKSLVDKLNGTESAINWLRSTSPDDEILFASIAAVLETKSITPIRWYQRIFERPAVLMLTKRQLVLKNRGFFPIVILYSVWIMVLLIIYLIDKNGGTPFLILATLLFILPYLPYQRQIRYSDIRKILLNPMNTNKTELVIDINGQVIHTVFAQALPSKALKIITTRTQTVVNS